MENIFDLSALKDELKTIEKKLTSPDIWQDVEKSAKLGKKQKILQNRIDRYNALLSKAGDLELICDLAISESDLSMRLELKNGMRELLDSYEKMRLETLLDGKYDSYGAILSVHAGSGGRDAMDWNEMLYRMYLRWAERMGYKVEVLDEQRDVAAGMKSASIRIIGENAYGFLRSEHGVHRVVRISPFDSTGRRHTSFAAVDLIPDIDDEINVEINAGDLKIDTYRASGAGGQHVNTTDSAVRITHLPTGVVVQCQNERSQITNREVAMKMLTAKLLMLKEQEHQENINELHGDFSEISWGSQIRSYVFHPYQMVKDHRTGIENAKVNDVMDGDLDEFIHAFLTGSES